MWALDTIARAVNGTVLRAEAREFSAVSTDSRTIGAGELFIPLKGPNFDGHSFMGQAYVRSKGGALCDAARREIFDAAPGTIVLVEDTNQALLDLARFKREHTGGTFVAITGSNGKTTTKELLVHLVGDLFRLAFNQKNYNNQVGVAKTLLAIEGEPEFGIIEMGTNHQGEIEVLARMAQPDMSLITNVNPSHLEGLSDLEGVRREKLSLFENTRPGGTVFVNDDDPSLSSYNKKGDCRRITFSLDHPADCTLEIAADRGIDGFDINLTFPGAQSAAHTRLIGRHNLYNVLAASSLAFFMGVPVSDLAERIASFEPYHGRFNPMITGKGYVLVDDAYNANPASMQWAVRTLADLPCKGKRVAILGGMRELGEEGERYHRELGRALRESDLSLILLFGEPTRVTFDEIGNGRARFFEDKSTLIGFAASVLNPEDIVLVKGSRAFGMDEIVEALI
jgi:UDP-N-acetylmuramoyl-tripeptide--D-alanyl-D-alanine ligase